MLKWKDGYKIVKPIKFEPVTLAHLDCIPTQDWNEFLFTFFCYYPDLGDTTAIGLFDDPT